MEIRNQRIFLNTCFRFVAKSFAIAMISVPVFAADEPTNTTNKEQQTGQQETSIDLVKPKVERRQIDEDDIDTEDFEIGVFFGNMSIEDFGSNTVSGMRLNYHISEDFFLEAQYGASKAGTTSYEDISGSTDLLTDAQRDFTYYDLSIGYNVLPGEAFLTSDLAVNTAFFLLIGAGNTDFAEQSHFTISYGAGYRVLVNDWLDITAGMRTRTFDSDLLGRSKSTNHLSYELGFNIFF